MRWSDPELCQAIKNADPEAVCVALVIAFFAGAAVATCAFLLWM